MVKQEIMPKVYKEVFEIVKYLPEEVFHKIPKQVIKEIHDNMDKDYEYDVNVDHFQNQEMLYETQLILAIFFRDYWATEEQRMKIIAKEKYDEQVYQEELRRQYNPEDLFKDNKKMKMHKIQEEIPMEKYQENIFQKAVKFIKAFLSKIKNNSR